MSNFNQSKTYMQLIYSIKIEIPIQNLYMKKRHKKIEVSCKYHNGVNMISME
jgi:hypothetical protein